MPFPVAHGIVAMSLFIGLQRRPSVSRDWKLMLLCAALSILPDADFALEWIFKVEDAHRSFTHSIAFSAAVGLLAAVLVGARELGQRLALVLAPVSHAVLDALVTSRRGTGTQLLWPVSTYRFRLGLIDYFLFDFNPRFNPWDEIFFRFVQINLFESAVLIPLFVIFVILRFRKPTKTTLAPD